jgi:peptide/nickel transport system substrate-binding protein
MINPRYILRLAITYISRFKGFLTIGVLLGILTFFAARFALPFFLIQTERIGIAGRYHTDNLPEFILSMISDGLTKIDDSGTVEPSLAASWETPDRGKTWIFHLKDNLVWQDGTKLTSGDITYEFSDVETTKPDEYTISFKLINSFTPFPSVVSKPTFRKGLLGTGEWQVEKITIVGSIVQKLVLENRRNEKKIFKFYPTFDRTRLAYKLGQVDKIIDTLDPSPFDTWETARVSKTTNTNQVVTLFFNTQDILFSDKSFRQALTYAIDKKALGERAISPISPNSWGYNPQVKQYKYDPQKAKEIISELPDELVQDSEVKLVSSPALLSTAEAIADNWEAVGIKTVVQVSSIIPEKFQVFLSIYDIPKDPDQYSIWHSTQVSTNISNYSNPRIDKLLEDGRGELDFEERRKIYLDFQRFLLEDAPAAFLYHPIYYTISRK